MFIIKENNESDIERASLYVFSQQMVNSHFWDLMAEHAMWLDFVADNGGQETLQDYKPLTEREKEKQVKKLKELGLIE